MFEKSQAAYQADETLTAELIGDSTVPDGVTDTEFAAWIAEARVLLNLDGFITSE